jgi:hypothetical protein
VVLRKGDHNAQAPETLKEKGGAVLVLVDVWATTDAAEADQNKMCR